MADSHGNKAKNLLLLKTLGFKVPEFIVLEDALSPEEALVEIQNHFKPHQLLAIRSSAEVEDSAERSHAGAFHTELAVPLNLAGAAFEKVKASMPKGENGIIVQHFIPSDYSGVCFVDFQLNQCLVNALPGLCKAVVEGWASEHYEYKHSELRKNTFPKKAKYLEFDASKGITEREYQKQNRTKQLEEVVQTCTDISKKLGGAQDIEWCFFEAELFILQARPISRSPWNENDAYMLFDSANVGESYSGIISPLTFSFARKLYQQVYIDLLNKSGVSMHRLERYESLFKHLVSLQYGRMYYRMDNWYRMMSFLPGYKKNKANLEKMLSLNLSENIDVEVYKPSVLLALSYYPRVFLKFIGFSGRMKKLKQKVLDITRDTDDAHIASLTSEACISAINKLFSGVLRKWYLTVENDTVMMSLWAYLSKGKSGDELAQILSFHSKSTEQLISLVQLSKNICAHDELKTALVHRNKKRFVEGLLEHPAIFKNYQSYLQEYGSRFANELKLETKNIEEDFEHFAGILLNYSQIEAPKIFKNNIKEAFLIRFFKRFASRREEFRLLRATMFALVRKLILRIADHYVLEGKLHKREDIFYMDFEDLILGKDPDIKDIEQRKLESDLYAGIEAPAFFKVINGEWPSGGEQARMENQISASGGVVRGIALVMENFGIPEKGSFDVLVTKRTDPGWTPVLGMSKALVVEHGGILSHASIVARELGIPAVIGVTDACKRFKTGELLLVDGDKAEVHQLKTNEYAR